MPADMLTQARRFSLWLSRQLDSGQLDTARLQPLLEAPLRPQDFAGFAPWASIAAAADEAELARQLRLLRRYVLAQIMVRDLCGAAPLAEVTESITRLADFAVNTALAFAEAHYAALYGTPIGRYSGAAQHLSVVAMGKAGGFELNVSSDIDLIFVYPEAGETDGRRSRSNQEFFTKVGQKLIALLNDITADGQVFRVDMRLRPDGDSGALVLSETALEQYLIVQGREWERYAWCKGRVITPYENGIRSVVQPFVFRKYLDYSAYEALRGLHRQIRSEVSKKGMQGNIKLGAGGIREVEFVAQIFQMIRGGQNRSLQLKGTQETLAALAEAGILAPEAAARLLEAYRFLRRLEHRLQYWDDQQTQTLPESPEQQALLAESMGFASYEVFSGSLNEHRSHVAEQFNHILSSPEEAESAAGQPLDELWQGEADAAEWAGELAGLGFEHAQAAAERLAQIRSSSRYRHLSVRGQQRFDAVLPRVIAAAAESSRPADALPRLLDFLDSISRRSAYLAFLQKYPAALKQVAELMAQSPWLAEYLQQHPVLLDELLSAQLMERPNWPQFIGALSGSLQAAGDPEAKMDVLRRFKHAQTFRLTVQDLAGLWPLEALSDQLSYLADILLEHTLQHVWQAMPKVHRPMPQFAIIGYGKLGGKELAYASDLDLVYLYDDSAPEAADVYSKFARRLTTWLSGSTGAGTLYQTDLRLRPNGDSGFQAHSLEAFAKYQHENAWIWEHQALSRARFVAGSPEVGRKFEAIRRQILSLPRDEAQLRQEVADMRNKMLPTHPAHESNVKYARGGVVDVEFIVQFWVLLHARRYPELLENYGNIALLDIAARRGLVSPEAAARTAAAYRHYRQVQHRQQLHGAGAVQVDAALLAHYAQVAELWQTVFGEAIR
ncbi:bifunctional glutamine synthetase adenylyltransferase/deadenyltransferase [Eikenella longinqua]|uniref:Bifunctional glutamine synthetase adenylyltransferase/adenylyl-removing enzyme n=1 Tax=Eikenella longinqua TaxID=1795827 RepID=A0A1A9S0P7_9NEIS|nr:bifunctional [glutamate--ammonia ligase]-adenylyl-L-tyrosine phosphorylase/[glutamate--ammonia-ligase] adenylyltransferase [Eikenella longinqua]OAM29962.1 bifunctional glutamine synthetase adenylyltransferase/deadenyltransferase [Eikenella longinqua]